MCIDVPDLLSVGRCAKCQGYKAGKKQSLSLVHSTAIGKCYWGCVCYGYRSTKYKNTEESWLNFHHIFLKTLFSKCFLEGFCVIAKQYTVIFNLFQCLSIYIYCHLWLKISVTELAHTWRNLLFSPLWLTALAPDSGNEKFLLEP